MQASVEAESDVRMETGRDVTSHKENLVVDRELEFIRRERDLLQREVELLKRELELGARMSNCNTRNSIASNSGINITKELKDLFTAFHRDIQLIKRNINSIYLKLDMSDGLCNDVRLNLPIKTEKELYDFETLLKKDATACLQYKKMIRNINASTFQEHVRCALNATMTHSMACQLSWTGQITKIMVKDMKCMDLIIEIVINCKTDSTINKVQDVIKQWLPYTYNLPVFNFKGMLE